MASLINKEWLCLLTHWGRVTHICVSKQIIIGSDNGLSPGRRQAIIWTNAGILFIGPLGTKFNEILLEIQTFSFKKMYLKMSSGKWQPFCLGLNVLSLCCHWLNQAWWCIFEYASMNWVIIDWSKSLLYVQGKAINSTNTDFWSLFLTHWGRVTHIYGCVSKLTSIGSDKGLSPCTNPLSEPMLCYC